MKIRIVGAGPGGLYFAYLVMKHCPGHRVEIIEQNPPDATFGFGVTLADGGLKQLQQVDEESFERITAELYWVPEQQFCHGGDRVWIDKKRPGGSVERLRLLRLLQRMCEERGVRIEYERRIDRAEDIGTADLIIGADGANSTVRRLREREFGTTSRVLGNRFAWYGVRKAFPTSFLDFRFVPGGAMVGHYYPYEKNLSTFVMECDEHTWRGAGFEALTDEERRLRSQAIFADVLDGLDLIANKSVWRQFTVVHNARWHVDNWVLLGDALEPGHFSIGSGTRLALEDSIALFHAVRRHGEDVPAVLAHYVAERGPQKAKLTQASENSLNWYEDYRLHMLEHDVVGLARSFLMRTGRITPERLEREFPRFMERYRSQASA